MPVACAPTAPRPRPHRIRRYAGRRTGTTGRAAQGSLLEQAVPTRKSPPRLRVFRAGNSLDIWPRPSPNGVYDASPPAAVVLSYLPAPSKEAGHWDSRLELTVAGHGDHQSPRYTWVQRRGTGAAEGNRDGKAPESVVAGVATKLGVSQNAVRNYIRN